LAPQPEDDTGQDSGEHPLRSRFSPGMEMSITPGARPHGACTPKSSTKGVSCLSRTATGQSETPMRRVSSGSWQMETPRQKGLQTAVADIPGNRTPVRTPTYTGGWPGLSSVISTPEVARRSIVTPPSGPAMAQQRMRDEVHMALERCDVSMLKLALLRGHGTGMCQHDHSVYEATRRQHFAALKFLLEQGSQDMDEPCCGHRPLHLAIQACMTEGDTGFKMSQLLLQCGAVPDIREGDDRLLDIPLHDAAKRGSVAAATLLLAHRADANISDANGHTPLHAACQTAWHVTRWHMETVDLLLRNGANPLQQDAVGFPPRRYARDGRLKEKLARAERWWGRRNLTLALDTSHLCGLDTGMSHASVWSLEELRNAVLNYL